MRTLRIVTIGVVSVLVSVTPCIGAGHADLGVGSR